MKLNEKMNRAIVEGAEEFIDYCKKLYDAYDMPFSWSWFIKGVNALPSYNKSARDDPRCFSTPMGDVSFTPFTKGWGNKGYSCYFTLSLTISTRKLVMVDACA